MMRNPEKPTKDSFERSIRDLRYTEFVVRTLDDRHNIEQLLRYKATSTNATYRGYREDTYAIPEHLNGLLEPVSDATLDFTIERTLDGVQIIDTTITTDDRRPVFIHEEPGLKFDVVEQGDATIKLPRGAVGQTMRSFLPEYIPEDITVEQMIHAFAILSPEKDEVVEFSGIGSDFFAQIRFTEIETFNDSIQTLEVISRKLHPSGATIGTRMRIVESLLGRINGDNVQSVNQSLEIHAEKTAPSPVLTVEDILGDGSVSVEVKHPTERHIKEIQAALAVLKRAQL